MEIFGPVLLWWILLQIMGLAALPIAFSLFRGLGDRGYAFAKPLGLLLSAYLLWLLASLGFMENSRSAAAFAVLAIGALGWGYHVLYRDRASETERLVQVLLRRWRTILAVEVLFASAFLLWAVIRAYNPDIEATEKPMEIAFLNAILRSDRFPPHDPWLSGFAISYYYFGYVMMAMLTRLSGVASGVAFNLGIALLFAMTATGAFGVIYNLLARGSDTLREDSRDRETLGEDLDRPREASAIRYGLLGSLFVAGIGNLEGLLELLHSRGLGSDAFWNWIDVKNLAAAPRTGGVPTDNWWWWRASRVVHDKIGDFSIEVIDEFPFFSFLLGDMHPHVLALPFVFIVLALAVGLMRRGFPPSGREMLLIGVVVGSLGFLNAWDLPTYGLIVVAGYAVGRRRSSEAPNMQWLQPVFGWIVAAFYRVAGSQRRDSGDRGWVRDAVGFAVVLVLLSIVLYLPFYIGLRSQARGLLPVLFVKTRLHQYLIMFGPFLAVMVAFLVVRWRELGLGQRAIRDWAGWTVGILAVPLALLAAALAPIAVSAQQREYLMGRIREAERMLPPDVTAGLPLGDLAALLRQGLTDPLLAHPWLVLLLAGLIAASLLLLRRHADELSASAADGSGQRESLVSGAEPASSDSVSAPRNEGALSARRGESSTFVFGLFAVALALTFVVEFIYLHDTFGTRMNTVFKLWYQAWVLLAVASAFALSQILPRLRAAVTRERLALGGWLGVVGLLFLGTLVYPPLSIGDKTRSFAGPATLDGTAYLARRSPDDSSAISWLRYAVDGSPVILEATGGSYTYAGRISAFTGLPTLLGWGGHELQWRGNYDEPSRREPLIDTLYTGRDATSGRVLDQFELGTLMDESGVTYLYVGRLEEDQYGARAALASRWEGLVRLVYDSGGAAIFMRIGALGPESLGG